MPVNELLERERFLRELGELLREISAGGPGRIVLVSGEAGIGKTSLVKQLVREHPDWRLWWGGCDALETPTPLAPLHEIALRAPVCLPALADSASSRAALFAQVLDALGQTPTLAVFEDVHWADDATLDLLKFLGRRIDRAPALLVMSFRDDEVPAGHVLRRMLGDLPQACVTRFALPALSPAAVNDLARRALRSPEGLYAVTRGNPFFVSEVLRHGMEGIPGTVHDVVLARFARLPAGARMLVELAAIVPTRIERWLIEKLATPKREDLEACLDSGLLLGDATSLFFRHEIARVAVEASLAPPVSQSLHRRVLDALLAGTHDHASAARLAHHAARGDAPEAVRQFASLAACEARERRAHREAAAHFEAALRHAEGTEPGPRAQWLEGFAVENLALGRLDEAIAAHHRLEALHRARGDVLGEGDCLSQLALVLVVALRNAEADACSRRSIALLEAMPPGIELARAWQVQAQLRMLNRDIEEAVQWGNKAVALAEALGNRPVLSAALGSIGAARIFVDYDEGRAFLERAVAIALEEDLDYVAANNYANLGSAAGEMFRFDDAVAGLERAIAFSSEREVDFYREYATAWLALCNLFLGQWDDAECLAREVLERPGPSSTTRIVALVALGRVRTRRGGADGAELLDEALELARDTGTLQRLAPVRCARAEAAWLAGEPSRVQAEAREAFELASRHGHPWFAGELAFWMSRSGTRVEAPTLFEPYALQLAGQWREAAAAWQSLGCPYERARALEDGDDEAQREALALFDSLGAVPAAEALRRRMRAAGVTGIARGARPSTRENAFGLTAREAQVLELLREGLRNSEIAERLVRSVRTVDHHIAAILGKMGVASRGEAIARARGQDGQAAGPK